MVNKWFFNLNLLPKSKEEQTDVISGLLFTFAAYKLQKRMQSIVKKSTCFFFVFQSM